VHRRQPVGCCAPGSLALGVPAAGSKGPFVREVQGNSGGRASNPFKLRAVCRLMVAALI